MANFINLGVASSNAEQSWAGAQHKNWDSFENIYIYIWKKTNCSFYSFYFRSTYNSMLNKVAEIANCDSFNSTYIFQSDFGILILSSRPKFHLRGRYPKSQPATPLNTYTFFQIGLLVFFNFRYTSKSRTNKVAKIEDCESFDNVCILHSDFDILILSSRPKFHFRGRHTK